MRRSLFPLRSAAEAAKIDAGFLSQRINRGDPVLDEERDIEAEGRGSARMFSFETILQVAIAERLRALGIPFKYGLLSAAKFVIFGDCGDNARAPGQPFADGDTLLVYTPEGTGIVNVHRNAGDDVLMSILCDALGAAGNNFPAGAFAAAIVDAGAVYHEVRRQLELETP